jgi:hypothetical protein
MNTLTRSSTVALAAILSVFALSGCAPTDPIAEPEPTLASPSASSTPEPTLADPVATSIVISAASVSVFDETATLIVDLPFDGDPAIATGLLTEVLNETPSVVTYEGGSCQAAGSTYSWGGLALFTAGTATMAPGTVFTVQASGVATANGVQVFGPHDLQVGATLAEVLAVDPGALHDEPFEGSTRIALEHSSGAGPDAVGVLGVAIDDVLHTINSPLYIFGDC